MSDPPALAVLVVLGLALPISTSSRWAEDGGPAPTSVPRSRRTVRARSRPASLRQAALTQLLGVPYALARCELSTSRGHMSPSPTGIRPRHRWSLHRWPLARW
jgi:hypothetical protein